MRRLTLLATLIGIGCQPVERPARTTYSPVVPAADEKPTAAPSATSSKHAESNQEVVIDRSLCGMPEGIREPDWPRTLSPVQADEPDPPAPGTTTLVVLPDTQYYASCKERHLPLQSQWIGEQMQARNIAATLTLGDLTEHNTAAEWKYVSDSLAPLFDKVPLLLSTGNHDHGQGGTADVRSTRFSQYFPAPLAATAPKVAHLMKANDLENAYYRLPQDGFTLGVLVLEWSPRDATVKWAKQITNQYKSDRKVFVTHAYLYNDNSRYDFAKRGDEQEWNPLAYATAKKDHLKPWSEKNAHPEGAHDGEMLWQKLLVDMPGLFLTLNGHVLGDGAGVLTSVAHGGAAVHQVLTNFQMLNEGGLGYLRIVEISPDGATLRMKTYSPSLKQYATDPAQHFTLAISPPLRAPVAPH